MKLSPDERAFLCHWMFDEANYLSGPGEAKRLQLEHGVKPAELSLIIAAAIPDAMEQQHAADHAKTDQPTKWPWRTDDELRQRIALAKQLLHESRPNVAS